MHPEHPEHINPFPTSIPASTVAWNNHQLVVKQILFIRFSILIYHFSKHPNFHAPPQ